MKNYQLYRLVLALVLLVFSSSLLLSQGYGKEEKKNVIIGSPFILEFNELEINAISSLASHWLEFSQYSEATKSFGVVSRKRQTFANQTLRVFYGFSRDARWDLGAVVQYGQVRLDENARSSIFKVFGSDTETGKNFSGLTYTGLRLRFVPMTDLPNLTLHAFSNFEVVQNGEIGNRLGANRNEYGANINYFHTLNDGTHYLLGGTWGVRPSSNEYFFFSQYASVSGFLIVDLYYDNLFAFGGMTYNGVANRKFEKINEQLYGGLGIQYQSLSGISAFLFGQVPFIYEDKTFSQVELIRESFSFVSLGVRYQLSR